MAKESSAEIFQNGQVVHEPREEGSRPTMSVAPTHSPDLIRPGLLAPRIHLRLESEIVDYAACPALLGKAVSFIGCNGGTTDLTLVFNLLPKAFCGETAHLTGIVRR